MHMDKWIFIWEHVVFSFIEDLYHLPDRNFFNSLGLSTNSITAIGALSPSLLPALNTRVYPPGLAVYRSFSTVSNLVPLSGRITRSNTLSRVDSVTARLARVMVFSAYRDSSLARGRVVWMRSCSKRWLERVLSSFIRSAGFRFNLEKTSPCRMLVFKLKGKNSDWHTPVIHTICPHPAGED